MIKNKRKINLKDVELQYSTSLMYHSEMEQSLSYEFQKIFMSFKHKILCSVHKD